MFTPLARRLSGVNPNAITVLSLLAGGLAGVAYTLAGHGPGWYLAGGTLVALSGAADSLDGLVARFHDRTSRTGDFLDHFGDRVVNVAIFAGLAFSPGATPEVGLGAVIVVMLNSYLGTQIEATFHRRYYGGLGKAELFVTLIVGSVALALFPGARISLGGRSVAPVDGLFVLLALGALGGIGHRLRYARQLCAGEDAGRRDDDPS